MDTGQELVQYSKQSYYIRIHNIIIFLQPVIITLIQINLLQS